MVALSRPQTRALAKLFKKVDILRLSFDNGEIDGDVVIHLSEQNVKFTLMSNGLMRKVVGRESHTAFSQDVT